jgi:NAD dependent epimerase/dehydratase family enzyme
MTLLNRGQLDDGFGSKVERLVGDRLDATTWAKLAERGAFDVVVDQVCYTPKAAQQTIDALRFKPKYYLYTSSESVYASGGHYAESDLDANAVKLPSHFNAELSYGEGKLQAEAVFAQRADFEVGMARVTFVLGPNDYTKRLNFHVDRVLRGEEIYFPNLAAKFVMVHESDVAASFECMIENQIVGPLNICAPSPITYSDFCSTLERVLKKPVRLAKKASDANHSPYGQDADWTMNVDRLSSFGFKCQEISTWLPELIADAQASFELSR